MKNQNYFKLILLVGLFCALGIFKTYSQQVYATTATELSSGNRVDDEGNAAANNGNLAKVRSYGGIAVGIGAYAGELKLTFPNTVPANTTTYIRVGDGGTGLLDLLLGGSLGTLLSNVVGTIALGDHFVEVSALDGSNNTVVTGRSDNITSSSVLKVVRNKDGETFFAITPAVDYKSVVIKDNTNALLLGTSNFINVHHAFYLDSASMFCNPSGIFTSYDGTGISLGLLDPLGVLGTTGVENPEYAIDDDDATYSKINVGIVSALATVYQDIQFPTTATSTDQLEIRIRGLEGALVNVAVLQNINIDLYNAGAVVYSTTVDAANLLALLPSAGGDISKVSVTPGVQFDKLRVTLVSPLGVNLAQQVDLFGAKITPAPPTLGPGEDNQAFCTIQNATVANLAATVGIGSVIWYDQETGGTAYAGTDALTNGTVYYGATLDGSCESLSRVAVTVAVSDSDTPTTTEATQSFCAVDNPKISDLSADVTAGVITWYDQAIGGTAYTSTDVLVDGEKYYAANTVGSCESSSRLEVTAVVTNPTIPTTVNANQSFCAVDAPTIADLDATASGTIIWYNQAIGGTAYTSADVLVNGNTYYAANSDGTCEGSSRLEVTVTVSDAAVPTTTQTTQSFCTVDAPTVADLDATASGTVTWYNQAVGGAAYADTDVLVNGNTYYAANINGSCESSLRLEVTVEIGDSAVPTTTEATQSFCTVDNPKISDLSADVATGVITWYDQAIGGTAYADTDVLVNGDKYYAANTVGTCESSTRLEVSVSISDATTPTTTVGAAQSFCAANNPTVADLDATASGTIIWYNQAVDGTAYVATDALIDGGEYYAANLDGSCESSSRLKVTVSINNPSTPTTTVGAAQSFCAVNNPTVADLDATASGTVVWYNQASGGTAYASTDVLIDGGEYYAANLEGGCESDTRLKVTVEVANPSTPTTTVGATQSFCAVNNPTVADLDASASGTVIWYDQAVGGTAYSSTDVLVDGDKYYAVNLDRGCESSSRLEVSVSVSNPATPTTTVGANQSFCAIDSPTIADLDATASGTIVWYNQASGGTAYASTDVLIDGGEYYAANLEGGCESPTRLKIEVAVNGPAIPTTTEITQSFCTTVDPTIADLDATASGTIVWYNQASGGTAYANTDLLVDGTSYYAANLEGGCESTTRLKVDVILGFDLALVGTLNGVCLGNTETYELPTGLAPYTWTVTGGNVISGGSSNDHTIEIQWLSLSNTKIDVEITGGCYLSNVKTFDIGVTDVCTSSRSTEDLEITSEVNNINPEIEEEITFTVRVINTSSSTMFMDVNISEILTSGFTYVSSSTTMGAYDSSTGMWNIPTLSGNDDAEMILKVKVNSSGNYLNTAAIIDSTPLDASTANNSVEILVEPSCLKVYNHMTPNGDGMNDCLMISCIENYDNTMLEIFDRYGALVYKKANYKNDWDGVANQTSTIIKKGEQLPNGTYFYHLELNNGSKPKTGWIQITK
ncbi:hypothetical protein AXE80_12475 [Wenyingzhuangia fucanilytica]|uniref:DUF11 domain-containing protein n=1 Tax=Wenyingzhuangia fucanilytica TaxID=1790137 RepID=A0A1B1Y8E5_9FLAO|nr:gliding motility-associated C-terminal domain-containing protein [Wenyingzhuangia fucanilytica]ANW97050.1 hypothetical protein AXE80_12475 [Wenyingzhuangia fucanilytica]